MGASARPFPTSKPDNVDLREQNSGLFWSTKLDVTRIGHGGSDPGVKTEMLSDLSKEVGVILFTNTSLCGPDARHYLSILLELWKHAEALKKRADAGIARGQGDDRLAKRASSALFRAEAGSRHCDA